MTILSMLDLDSVLNSRTLNFLLNIKSTTSSGISFRLALLTTFVTFCAFYAPQPLLPELSNLFSVSATEIALLITVTFVFLSIAPLAYGILIQRISAQRVLVLATGLLGLLQFTFASADSYEALLLSRGLQGVLYPAIFTAAVTYCSKSGEQEALASRVTLYVAMTILGGVGGRLLGGFVSSYFSWQSAFYLLGAALLLCSLVMTFAIRDSNLIAEKVQPHSIGKILTLPYVQSALALIFCVFFTFSAILNALPFRLRELDPLISNAHISLVYLGYFVGIFFAANATGIARVFGGKVMALCIALSAYLTGVLLLLSTSATLVIAVGFLTASAFFLIHSTLTAHINATPNAPAGMVNGLYISVYYFAGACGSVLPLWIYNAAGWHYFLAALGSIAAIGFVILLWMRSLQTTGSDQRPA